MYKNVQIAFFPKISRCQWVKPQVQTVLSGKLVTVMLVCFNNMCVGRIFNIEVWRNVPFDTHLLIDAEMIQGSQLLFEK